MNTSSMKNDNIQKIRNQIKKKKESNPHIITEKDTTSILTDFDHFPYSRWYRGVPTSDNPVIMEREAGWRKIEENCYKSQMVSLLEDKPDSCFCKTGTCSTSTGEDNEELRKNVNIFIGNR